MDVWLIFQTEKDLTSNFEDFPPGLIGLTGMIKFIKYYNIYV